MVSYTIPNSWSSDPPMWKTCPIHPGTRYNENVDFICPYCRFSAWTPPDTEEAKTNEVG